MELLFSKHDSFSLSEHVLGKARQVGNGLAETALKAASDDEIVSRLTEDHSLVICEILWDQTTVRREEAMVDLRFVPNTMAFYEQRSVMRSGEKYIISVPYSGEKDFFFIRPSTYTMNPPRATVDRRQLLFEYSGLEVDVEKSKREFEESKTQISTYLNALKNDFEKHNLQLPDIIRPIVESKRSRMQSGEQKIASFGFPIG